MVWAAVLLVATGFLVKRTLLPRTLDSLRRRPAPVTREVTGGSGLRSANRETEQPRPPAADRSATKSNRNARSREALTEHDRRELDRVLNRKLK